MWSTLLDALLAAGFAFGVIYVLSVFHMLKTGCLDCREVAELRWLVDPVLHALRRWRS
jgi:hypothetical protein